MPEFSYKTCLEVTFYIALLFFIVPIKIEPEAEYQMFLEYLHTFNKSYPEENEFSLRLEAFKKSLKIIHQLNDNNSSEEYGLTKFSDLTPEEFMQLQNNIPKRNFFTNSEPLHRRRRNIFSKSLPVKVDWREKNVISKVKNQNGCGACWAFSIIEVIESVNAIKCNNLTELSIQQVIDCSVYNYGCYGGDLCSTLHWMKIFNVTITTENVYPLTLKNEECRHGIKSEGVKIGSYFCGSLVSDEHLLLKYIATNGPVAVGVSGQTWQNYIGGVIQFHCDGPLSHAVQIVGYDLTADVPHYIVKNSWGYDWGDNGYLYIAIGKDMCGVTKQVAGVFSLLV